MSDRDVALFAVLIPGVLAVVVPIALGRARDASRGAWRTAWIVVAWLWFYLGWCGTMTFHCATACGVVLLICKDGALAQPALLAIGATWLALLGIGIAVTKHVVLAPSAPHQSGERERENQR